MRAAIAASERQALRDPELGFSCRGSRSTLSPAIVGVARASVKSANDAVAAKGRRRFESLRCFIRFSLDDLAHGIPVVGSGITATNGLRTGSGLIPTLTTVFPSGVG